MFRSGSKRLLPFLKNTIILQNIYDIYDLPLLNTDFDESGSEKENYVHLKLLLSQTM